VSITEIKKSKKASAPKTKRPQPPWLKAIKRLPAQPFEAPPIAEGETRLMSKAEVCALVGATFPTIWEAMRRNTFPRSRIFGGRSVWISTEVYGWLANLKVRPLKPLANDEAVA
jgi:predicted DNA-binding transcriptional regulator AlpA